MTVIERRQLETQRYAETKKLLDCVHDQSMIVRRTLGNLSVQYRRQCQRCGESVGNAIAKVEALRQSGGSEPPPWNKSLQEDSRQKRNVAWEKVKLETSEAFWDSYDDYLKSSAWKVLRERVLRRANGVCEGCGVGAACQVHHVTYEHVGCEFLFELVALCLACHERIHPDHTGQQDAP